MRVKSCPVAVKASDDQADAEKGIFEALVATWDLDSVGDKITKGAFAETLAEWKTAADGGTPLPVIWSHMHQDPNAHVGWVLDAKETDKGLWIKGQIDLDNPTATSNAPQVWRLLKGGRVAQFSFAYDVLDGQWIERTTDGEDESYYELSRLKVYEVGPTLIGANQATELISAKSAGGRPLEVSIAGLSAAESPAVRAAVQAAIAATAGEKRGRVLSSKHEDALRSALERLTAATDSVKSVLSALPEAPDDAEAPAGLQDPIDDEKHGHAAPSDPQTEAPTGGKASDGPTGTAPAITRLTADFEAMALELDLLTA